jgi:hypothetical protein
MRFVAAHTRVFEEDKSYSRELRCTIGIEALGEDQRADRSLLARR